MKTFGLAYLVFGALLGITATLATPGFVALAVIPVATFCLGVWAFKRRPSRIVFAVGFMANLGIALAIRFWFYVPDRNGFSEVGQATLIASMAIAVIVCFVVYALEMEAGGATGE